MSNQLFIENLIHQVGIAVAECDDDKLVLVASDLIEDLKLIKADLEIATGKLDDLISDVSALADQGVKGVKR